MDMVPTHARVIDAIPTEIWDKIFLHATLQPRNQEEVSLLDARFNRNPALFISQTCTKWRDIALSRPLYWSALTVHFHDNTTVPNQHLVQLMVDRSATTLLTIDLRIVNVDQRSFNNSTSAIYGSLETLLRSLSRWQQLRLFVRTLRHQKSHTPQRLTQQLIEKGAPSLECFQLDAELTTRESKAMLDALRGGSPLLRKWLIPACTAYSAWLTPQLSYIPQAQAQFMTAYHQITSLHITGSILEEYVTIPLLLAIRILHSSPNLISCVLSNVYDDSFNDILYLDIEVIILTQLQHLQLSAPLGMVADRWTESITIVLGYIAAPSLTTIAFGNMEIWSQRDFDVFLDRSGCSIKEIVFFNPGMNSNLGPTTFIPILRALPSIKGVHIGCMYKFLDDPTFVDAITAWNTTRNEFELCPELMWLSFQDILPWARFASIEDSRKGMENLGRILKTRLNPPDPGKKTFEKICVPAQNLDPDDPDPVYSTIQSLLQAEPYASLHLQTQDEEMYNIYDLWHRYGDIY